MAFIMEAGPQPYWYRPRFSASGETGATLDGLDLLVVGGLAFFF